MSSHEPVIPPASLDPCGGAEDWGLLHNHFDFMIRPQGNQQSLMAFDLLGGIINCLFSLLYLLLAFLFNFFHYVLSAFSLHVCIVL